MPVVDADYDTDNGFARAKGMENAPERGIRCTMCFDMRFERTALYAHEHGFPVMTRSLGISRWKNMAQINDCGRRAAAPYAGLAYWDHDWRKGGGSQRMVEISKHEHFHQQEYCWLHVFAARQQPPSTGAEARQDQVRSALLRQSARTGHHPR